MISENWSLLVEARQKDCHILTKARVNEQLKLKIKEVKLDMKEEKQFSISLFF